MALDCNSSITSLFDGYLSNDWMFYCACDEISLYDYNKTTQQLEFVGICGVFVFLKTLTQQRIAIAIKDTTKPLLFIFREIDPLCTVVLESYTITFRNNGSLFAIVFIDNEMCKQCFDCINKQVEKHFQKHLKKLKITPKEARKEEVTTPEVNPSYCINGENMINKYLNCSLSYHHLPNPFKKLDVPQTVSLIQALPHETHPPDPLKNQRLGMGITPPIVPILTLQEMSKEMDTKLEINISPCPKLSESTKVTKTSSEMKLKVPPKKLKASSSLRRVKSPRQIISSPLQSLSHSRSSSRKSPSPSPSLSPSPSPQLS
ncbi:Uncharacterized protein QTN25_005294 [Entamoeba marina]